MLHSAMSMASPCCCGGERSRGGRTSPSMTAAVPSANRCKHKQRERSTMLKRDHGRHLWPESPLRPAACWPGGGGIHLKGKFVFLDGTERGEPCQKLVTHFPESFRKPSLLTRCRTPSEPGRWKVINMEVRLPAPLCPHLGHPVALQTFWPLCGIWWRSSIITVLHSPHIHRPVPCS